MQSQRRRAASKTPESISEGCLTDGTLYRRLKSQNCHNYAKIEIWFVFLEGKKPICFIPLIALI